jgi:putative membrane protein
MIDWSQWGLNPGLLDALVILGWAYALWMGPLRRRLAPGEPWPRAAAIRFYSGLGLVYLAAGSPAARIGGLYLFSVHVCLQLLILFPAAALILRGLPHWFLDAALQPRNARLVARSLLRPWICGAGFTLLVSIWYVPRLLEWALGGPGGYAVELATVLLSGLLFWWPLASPSRICPAQGYGSRLVYLFAIEVALTAVFAYVLMAEHPIYPTYGLAPRLVPGLDAENDQILGGILMAGVSSLVLVGALGVNFFKWAKASEGTTSDLQN